jgi:hypothetical protein
LEARLAEELLKRWDTAIHFERGCRDEKTGSLQGGFHRRARRDYHGEARIALTLDIHRAAARPQFEQPKVVFSEPINFARDHVIP